MRRSIALTVLYLACLLQGQVAGAQKYGDGRPDTLTDARGIRYQKITYATYEIIDMSGYKGPPDVYIPGSFEILTGGRYESRLPVYVERIADRACMNNKVITSLTIDTVQINRFKSIGISAFEGCTSLKSVTFPRSLYSIESDAFYGCKSLYDIYLTWSTPADAKHLFVDGGAFYGIHPDCRAHIESGDEENWLNWDNNVDVNWWGILIEPNAYKLNAIAADHPEWGDAVARMIPRQNDRPLPDGYAYYDRMVELTARPAEHRRFVSWKITSKWLLMDWRKPFEGVTRNPFSFRMSGDVTYEPVFESDVCTVKAVSRGNGRVTEMFALTPAGWQVNYEFPYDATVQVKATPDAGYYFEKWTGDWGEPFFSIDNPYKFVVKGDMAIWAHFTERYMVYLTTSHGKIISGEGAYSYGQTVKAEVDAGEGYHFVMWTDAAGKVVSMNNPYQFYATDSTGRTVLHAECVPDTDECHVMLESDEEGEISSGAGWYPPGTEVRVEVACKEGWRLLKWTNLAGDSVSGDNPYHFVVKSNQSLTAHFAFGTYRLSQSVDGEGVMTVTPPGGVYVYPTRLTAEAFPREGYHFDRWTNGRGDLLSTANPYTFTMKEDMELQAHFFWNGYRVDLSVRNGTITSGRNGYYPYGASVTAEASPREGYHFVEWANAAGERVSTDNPYTFTVTENTILQAYFAADGSISYHVHLTVDARGHILRGGGTYPQGSETTVEADAGEGYRFVKWTNERGESVSTANPYTFVVNGDVSLHANFTVNTYHVILSAAENGRVKQNGGVFAYGTEVRAEATANPGYRFVRWADAATGGSLSLNNPYTFVVKSDMEVRAHFAVDTGEGRYFWVNLSAENGWSVEGSGSYDFGAKVKAEASSYYGYRFVKWIDEGSGDSLSAANPFTFTVTADVSIRAVYVKRSFTLSVSAGANGKVSGGGTVLYQGYVKAVAVADDGYHFVRWTDAEGESVSAGNPYEFQLLKDTKLTAVFAPGAPGSVVVTVFATEGGRATGGGNYGYGDVVKLEAFVEKGYYFAEWTREGEGAVSWTEVYTFQLAEGGAYAYTAHFAKLYDGNELLPSAAAGAYYADGALHLVNLEGFVISVQAVDGRQVLLFEAKGAEYAAALPAGIYILNAVGGKERYVTKFVVKA